MTKSKVGTEMTKEEEAVAVQPPTYTVVEVSFFSIFISIKIIPFIQNKINYIQHVKAFD